VVKSSWPTRFVALPVFGLWHLDFGPVLEMRPDIVSAIVAYMLVSALHDLRACDGWLQRHPLLFYIASCSRRWKALK
jgi:hypothetical protein